MSKSNAENVRIKRDYFAHLKGPGRQNEASIDAVAKALSRFESYTRNKDFKTFRKEQAIGFTAHLSREVNERTGEPLSKATLLSTLNALKAFFTWVLALFDFSTEIPVSIVPDLPKQQVLRLQDFGQA